MNSLASSAVRTAARSLRIRSQQSRSLASSAAAKPRRYQASPPSSSNIARASTVSKPAAPKASKTTSAAPRRSATTGTAATSAAAATKSPTASAPSLSPSPSSSSSSSPPSSSSPAAPRVPVPAVSGEPLPDAPEATPDDQGEAIDWASSFHGLGTSTFGPDVAAVLQAPLNPDDIEVKPDGIIYLPEIKYRRVLNAAFGPGGWGLAPRADLVVTDRIVSRDYALIVHGRFVGQARGEMQYFNDDGISTAAEGCKSNALMRCCKDLGIASELWDPRYIRKFMKTHAHQIWVEHVTTKKKKQIWIRKDDEVRYPFKKTN